jgi:hypothetical protein
MRPADASGPSLLRDFKLWTSSKTTILASHPPRSHTQISNALQLSGLSLSRVVSAATSVEVFREKEFHGTEKQEWRHKCVLSCAVLREKMEKRIPFQLPTGSCSR